MFIMGKPLGKHHLLFVLADIGQANLYDMERLPPLKTCHTRTENFALQRIKKWHISELEDKSPETKPRIGKALSGSIVETSTDETLFGNFQPTRLIQTPDTRFPEHFSAK